MKGKIKNTPLKYDLKTTIYQIFLDGERNHSYFSWGNTNDLENIWGKFNNLI